MPCQVLPGWLICSVLGVFLRVLFPTYVVFPFCSARRSLVVYVLLQFGDHTILSSSRVQQGDPLGPLGFVLALHPIVARIQRVVPGLLVNAWYLDDGSYTLWFT